MHRLICIFKIVSIFIRDAPVAIVLKFHRQIVSFALTTLIFVPTIHLMLYLLQIGLPAEQHWLDLHTGWLSMYALLNQLLKLFNV